MKIQSPTPTLWLIMAIAFLFPPTSKAEESKVRFRWLENELVLSVEFVPDHDVWIRKSSHVGDYPEYGKFGSLNITLIQNGRNITSQAFTHRITGLRGGSEFSSLHEAKEKTTLIYLLHKNSAASNEIIVNGKSICGEIIQTDLKALENGGLAHVVLHGSYKLSGDEFILLKQSVSIPKRP